MLVTLLGIVMLVNLLQSLNAEESMLVTPLCIVMLVKLLQPENASEPMLVTLLGIVKLVAVFPIAYCIKVLPSFVYKFPSTDLYLVLLASTVILVKLLQPENASEPMLVTLLGISMLVKLLQCWNA